MALCALGAGLSACNSDVWDKDPLAFMSSDPNEKRMKEEEEKKHVALEAAATVPPDMFSNVQPLEMKSGGTLGTMGLNLETYFAGDIKDDQERIKRLERALIAVHEDMKIMAPTTQRLADLEVAMKHKVETSVLAPPQPLYAQEQQQEMLPPSPPPTMQPVVTPSLPPAPVGDMPGTPVEPGARPMAPAPDGSAIVSGIRVGDHPDIVRIVFDVTSKNTSYTADLDNAEGILVVELPNARWKTPTDFETFKIMPVLESYKVDTFNNGAGNIFVLQLKSDTQIVAQGKYPALSGGGERIVIDLKK
ncbi:MAG TPA: hypothetical protein DEA55_04820 [Rhodospirillaceae bacterium]|nr:hypothetical protein [Rhodospirillaceae bacterium]